MQGIAVHLPCKLRLGRQHAAGRRDLLRFSDALLMAPPLGHHVSWSDKRKHVENHMLLGIPGPSGVLKWGSILD